LIIFQSLQVKYAIAPQNWATAVSLNILLIHFIHFVAQFILKEEKPILFSEQVDLAATPYTNIREVLRSDLSQDTDYPDRGFRDFSQSL
jgi:hypothetical protein